MQGNRSILAPRLCHESFTRGTSAEDLNIQRGGAMYTNRREFLKASAALLAALAAQPGRFAFAGGSDLQSAADALLGRAAENGDVPGVIAAATTRNDTIYEGAFGSRVLGQDAPMTMDTVVWIAC